MTSKIRAQTISVFSALVFVEGVLGACVNMQRPTGPEPIPSAPGQLSFAIPLLNSAENMKKPYVIMVSIDGYRYDYNRQFGPPQLNRVAQEGAAAESLRPVYPSKTFPNHYSLVTGLYADHHGIVSNEFYDPSRDQSYSLPDRKAVEDGSWYFGEPLWITAEKQGMRTASFFWVGSEADVQGMHPNYYYRYDEQVPYEIRVDQVINWLKLPEPERPHFLTLYFEGVDQAAHRFGTTSREEKEAVAKVDAAIGRLREGIAKSGLPINLVIVSDHGMQDLDAKKIITLDETPDAARILAKFQAVGRGPQLLLYLNKGESRDLIVEAQRILNKGARKYRVWRREQMAAFHYNSTPRTGDLVIEPDAPYVVGLRGHMPSATGANHGWDPAKSKLMHGIFYAVGPGVKGGARVATFDNVNVYPFVLELLQILQRSPIDGSIESLRPILKSVH